MSERKRVRVAVTPHPVPDTDDLWFTCFNIERQRKGHRNTMSEPTSQPTPLEQDILAASGSAGITFTESIADREQTARADMAAKLSAVWPSWREDGVIIEYTRPLFYPYAVVFVFNRRYDLILEHYLFTGRGSARNPQWRLISHAPVDSENIPTTPDFRANVIRQIRTWLAGNEEGQA